jgi:hypothetical protein
VWRRFAGNGGLPPINQWLKINHIDIDAMKAPAKRDGYGGLSGSS